METLMVNCVQNSLRLFMNQNAIFICEFPYEVQMEQLAIIFLGSSIGPNGAAGHYLLGLIYRRTRAIDHFTQALVIDPLLWSAYEELCILGAAEAANNCFNDSAALRVQQQHLSESASLNQHLTESASPNDVVFPVGP